MSDERDLRAMALLRSSRFGPGRRICFGRADAGWAVWGDGDDKLNPDRVPFFEDPVEAIEWAATVCLPLPDPPLPPPKAIRLLPEKGVGC